MFFTPSVTDRHIINAFAANRARQSAFAAWDSQGLRWTEDESSFSLELDVPGLAKDDLNITVEDDVVRITSKPDAKRQVRAAYRLPKPVQLEGSSAKLEQGVLSLHLRKDVPASREKTLEITG
jgi:HSP20 family protein